MRVFIAFNIPDNTKSKILDLEQLIKKKTKRIRLTPEDNLHITIKFLGEQPVSTVSKIIEFLNEESKKYLPFKVKLDRVGIFKDLISPRVLWLGENNNDYVDMSFRINKRLDIFRPSDNKLFCHLTIGRIKLIEKNELLDVLKMAKAFLKENELSFEVSNFYLYESKLNPKGAVYRKIEKFNLR